MSRLNYALDTVIADNNSMTWIDARGFSSLSAGLEALDGTNKEVWLTEDNSLTGDLAAGTYTGLDLVIRKGVTLTLNGITTIDFNIRVEDGGQVAVDQDCTINGNIKSKGNTSGVVAFDAVTGDETLTITGSSNIELQQISSSNLYIVIDYPQIPDVLTGTVLPSNTESIITGFSLRTDYDNNWYGLLDKFDGSAKRFINNIIRGDTSALSDGEDIFLFLLKPGQGDTSYIAYNYLIALNSILGTSNGEALGVSLDGNTEQCVVISNIIKNLYRNENSASETTRSAHGIALAGGEGADPNVLYDSIGTIIIGNSIKDIDGTYGGNGIHIEDEVRGTQVVFNTIKEVTHTGIQVINDYPPKYHNYIGNFIQKHTGYGIEINGAGHAEGISVNDNIIDGDGVTQTEFACLIGGTRKDTSAIFKGNRIVNQSVGGLDGRKSIIVVSNNYFENISGPAITGDGTDTFEGILVESNNYFFNVTSVVDSSKALNIRGDKIFISKEFDASVADEDIVIFTSLRSGILTQLTRILTSDGGGGTTNGTLSVELDNGTVLESFAIPRTGTKYDIGSFTSNGFENYIIPSGSILSIKCDGNGDAVTKVKVEVELFFYN